MKRKMGIAGVAMGALVIMQASIGAGVQGASNKPITIRMMMPDWGEEADNTWLHDTVDAYMKLHPGVKIQMQFVPGNDVDTKTILGVNSGDPPNLTVVYSDVALLAKRGVIMPLGDQFKKSNINPETFVPACWGAVQVNGVPYAFPAASTPVNVLWYNPAAMKAVGLNPNDPPKTWKQLYEDSVKAVKFGKKGNLERVGLQFNDSYFVNDEGNFLGNQEFWKQNGNQWTPSPVNSGNEAYLTYLKKLADLYGGYAKYSKWIASDQSWNGSVDYLAQGKSLFTIDGYWDYLGFDKYSPNFHYAVAEEPTANGNVIKQSANSVAQWAVAFPKGQTAAQFNAAWDFAVWAFDTHSWELGPTTNGSTVVSQQEKWDQLLIKQLPKDHKWFASSVPIFTNGIKYAKDYTPSVTMASYYMSQLNTAADNVLYGKMTPEQALNQAQQNVRTQETIGGQ